MLDLFHRLLLNALQINASGWSYFLCGLFFVSMLFILWLFGVALRQYRFSQELPKGSYNEEIEFGWATMGMVVLVGPWIGANVLPSILTAMLVTHFHLGGSLSLLDRISERVPKNWALV